MIPWSKLPKDVQKSILIMFILSGTATGSGCCPMVCDPAPPPPTTPKLTPTFTPMICDPAPPPSLTRTSPSSPTLTPMICDPAPPPSRTSTPGTRASITPMICDPAPAPSIRQESQTAPIPAAERHFQLRTLELSSDETLVGAGVRGRVVDLDGNPLPQIQVTAQNLDANIEAWSDQGGVFYLRLPKSGAYLVTVGGDSAHALPLTLNEHDLATVEWQEVPGESQSILPLAEIRTVDIVCEGCPSFNAETPWAGARLRWSVSGGRLVGEGEQVTWEPPSQPGRYLLQVVADWGRIGMAVDSVVLVLAPDRSVTVS